MTRPTQIGIAVAIYLALFTVLASIIFLALSPTADGSMLIAYYDYPVYQWWSYWLCCYSYPAVHDGLVQSGLAAALPPLIAVAAIAVKLRRITGRTLQPDWAISRLPRPAIRGVTDNYGHARWASLREPTTRALTADRSARPAGRRGGMAARRRCSSISVATVLPTPW